ncbi:helix-turn-helix domain-containing protein [Streptomyces goshikiensis]|uniref:helix-turn-helix domain-containing protein n=1 Tax=Streptomyces goshikiensis TaxID=1942 RepID=UPI0036A2FEAB
MGRHRRGHKNGHLPSQVRALNRNLAHLRRLGLITTAGPDGGEHAPVEPSIALEAMAHTRSAEVRQAHLAAMEAYRGYRRSVTPQATDDLIEVVKGPHVSERIWNIEEAVESQVLRFDSPPYHTHGTANPIEIQKLGNGVEYRAVYPMHLNDRVPSSLHPIHRRILELLATGVNDDTIAELLGVSRRTLSRHIEAMNTRAGSTTRFQMALYAARKGWI